MSSPLVPLATAAALAISCLPAIAQQTRCRTDGFGRIYCNTIPSPYQLYNQPSYLPSLPSPYQPPTRCRSTPDGFGGYRTVCY